MQLHEIIATLDAKVVEQALSRVRRTVTRQAKHDREIGHSLIRLLESPIATPQVERLRQLIRGIAHATD